MLCAQPTDTEPLCLEVAGEPDAVRCRISAVLLEFGQSLLELEQKPIAPVVQTGS